MGLAEGCAVQRRLRLRRIHAPPGGVIDAISRSKVVRSARFSSSDSQVASILSRATSTTSGQGHLLPGHARLYGRRPHRLSQQADPQHRVRPHLRRQRRVRGGAADDVHRDIQRFRGPQGGRRVRGGDAELDRLPRDDHVVDSVQLVHPARVHPPDAGPTPSKTSGKNRVNSPRSGPRSAHGR
jgi:hypothetical protein